MAKTIYPDSTPVDEPVTPAPKPKSQKSKPVKYPDSVPVDEPVKNYAKGGKVRGGGCEQRGKTKGRFV